LVCTNISRRTLIPFILFSSFLCAPSARAQAASQISIDFVGTGTSMASTETAGVVPAAHWNNAVGAVVSTPLALVDLNGAATSASVTWKCDNGWMVPITDVAGNNRMMRGYLDTGSKNPTTVTVSGLAAGTYDIYVYADGDNASVTRSATYQISGSGITTKSIGLTDSANTNFNGTFVQANGSAGNYVKFASVTATGFQILATPGTSSDAYPRAPVNGIQIVPAAPPAPDFSLSLSPSSSSVTQGGVASYTATVSALNGFTGTVSLTASGQPSGSTASLSSTSINASGTSTLSITTSASTSTGTTTLTVTGSSTGGSGTLTHSATASLTVTSVTSPTTYSIAGTLSPSSLGKGASVKAAGPVTVTTTAASNGTYTLSGLPSGTYVVTPTLSGVTFSPSSRSVTISHANITGLNFTAAVPTYSISGTISPTAGGSGAKVTLTGAASKTTTANSSGVYSFTGLSNGAYTVTPSDTGYTYSPNATPVNIGGASVSGINFTAAQNVIFFDDFTGSSIDSSTWTVMNRQGDYTNNEAECYTPSNVTVANGDLVITTKNQSISCNGTHYSYTSGMVQWTNFNFLYGNVEIRAKMAGGQGSWPALWFLGYNCQAQYPTFNSNGPCNWPQPGSQEIDMTEILNGNFTTVGQFMHAGSTNTSCQPTTSNVSQNWHTYNLIWSPGKVQWQIDGTTTCTVTTNVPSTPMFLIINNAVGGTGGGSVNPSAFPQTMLIDYVKIIQ